MQSRTTAGTVLSEEAPVSHTATQRWVTEDWVAVILGFLVIAAVLATFHARLFDLRNITSTFRWTTDAQIASMTPGWTEALDTIGQDAKAKRQENVAR